MQNAGKRAERTLKQLYANRPQQHFEQIPHELTTPADIPARRRAALAGRRNPRSLYGAPVPEDVIEITKKDLEEDEPEESVAVSARKFLKPITVRKDVEEGMGIWERITRKFGSVKDESMQLSSEERHLLTKFSSSLHFSINSEEKYGGEVFKRLQTVAAVPGLLHYLTEDAWRALWELEDEQTIPSIRSRILGELMIQNEVDMSESQLRSYIGGLFWNEGRDEAFRLWEEAVAKEDATEQMWDLGVRMHALIGEPAKAEEIIQKEIEALGEVRYKTWISVILAWNHLYQPEEAWRCYGKMLEWSEKNGEKVSPGKYDDIAMSFLDGDAPQMGLKVFKDMLTADPVTEADQKRLEIYQHMKPVIQEALAEVAKVKGVQDLNVMSVEVLRTFPLEVLDKHFYAGWMKGLITMGRTDLAWTIITRVMGTQSKVDVKHVNAVVRGFLGEEVAKHELGVSIAEEMILSRLRIVNPSCLPEKDRVAPWEKDPRCWFAPQADVQTFAVLFRHYTYKQDISGIDRLTQLLALSKLPPSAFIINHILFAHLYNNSPSQVLKSLSQFHPLPLDIDSMSILLLTSWKSTIESAAPVFPRPTSLYRTFIMPRLDTLFPSPPLKVQQFYRKLCRAFLASGPDEANLLPLVLNQLADRGVYPDPAVVEEVKNLAGGRKDRRRRIVVESTLNKDGTPRRARFATEIGVSGTWAREIRGLREWVLGAKEGEEDMVERGRQGPRDEEGEKRMKEILEVIEKLRSGEGWAGGKWEGAA